MESKSSNPQVDGNSLKETVSNSKVRELIDFSVIKEKVGAWIDLEWDHAMIVWEKDPDLVHIEKCSGFKKPYVTKFNPTAENLAAFLLNTVCPNLLNGSGVKASRIVLWETPNCKVEVSC